MLASGLFAAGVGGVGEGTEVVREAVSRVALNTVCLCVEKFIITLPYFTVHDCMSTTNLPTTIQDLPSRGPTAS